MIQLIVLNALVFSVSETSESNIILILISITYLKLNNDLRFKEYITFKGKHFYALITTE
jgi:hypothetical protein